MDALYQRTSIRTFNKEKISDKDQLFIKSLLKKTEEKTGPFGTKIKTFYFNDNDSMSDHPIKVGTYGFIKDAPAYFGGITQNSVYHIIDFGYLMEDVILELTTHQLGTVWLGGTFHRDQFSHLIQKDEFIPAISPVGYIDKRRIREQITRKVVAADRRKPLNEIAFLNDFSHPIDVESFQDARMLSYLEYIQIGPSASNKQPWRILVEDKFIHLHLERTPNYASALPYDIQMLDMGIALCHLEKGLIYHKEAYQFVTIKDPIQSDGKTYIISVERL